jgi:hypothetical protein
MLPILSPGQWDSRLFTRIKVLQFKLQSAMVNAAFDMSYVLKNLRWGLLTHQLDISSIARR